MSLYQSYPCGKCAPTLYNNGVEIKGLFCKACHNDRVAEREILMTLIKLLNATNSPHKISE